MYSSVGATDGSVIATNGAGYQTSSIRAARTASTGWSSRSLSQPAVSAFSPPLIGAPPIAGTALNRANTSTGACVVSNSSPSSGGGTSGIVPWTKEGPCRSAEKTAIALLWT